MTPSDLPQLGVMEDAVARAKRFDWRTALEEEGYGKMRDVLEILGASDIGRVPVVSLPPIVALSEIELAAARRIVKNQARTIPEPNAQGFIDLSPMASLERHRGVVNNVGSRTVGNTVLPPPVLPEPMVRRRMPARAYRGGLVSPNVPRYGP